MHKLFVASLILAFVTLGWDSGGFGQEVPTPRGELRIVDKHHANWISIVLNVFEHLVEFDTEGTLVPRLATSWRWLDDRTLEFTLRHGVKFHNGEVFDADIVKLNWEDNTRLQQPSPAGPHLNFKPGSRLEILDPYTVRFVFPEPDGGALTKLSLLHMANRQFYREFGWGEKRW
jgi:ABC-type transport system substrate-binding protein